MWIQLIAVGGVGIRFLNLPLLAMARIGVAMVSSSLRQQRQVDVDDSRITQIPDDILIDVVSRLPTIEASRTSILSRRWRRIWIMNPKIHFSCIDTIKHGPDPSGSRHANRKDKRRFVKAVDQCLELYSGQKLKTFSMNFCFLGDYASHLEQWIQSLDRLGVEEIFLFRFCCSESLKLWFNLPFQLLSGISTLRRLHLAHCNVLCLSGQFNSLRTLTLYAVPLLGDQISSILLSCPNLKNLTLQNCPMPLKLKISGANLKLKNLLVFRSKGLQEVDICASNLFYVYIEDYRVYLSVSSAPKLERLYFQSYWEQGRPYPFVGVASYLPSLTFSILQTRTDQMPSIPQMFNLFSNLRKLYLLMSVVSMVDYGKFSPVLNMCPLLEAFYVGVNSKSPSKETEEGEWPVLRHKHLQHMELSGFSKTPNEFEFILASTQVLRCLVLRSSFRASTVLGFMFLKRESEILSDNMGDFYPEENGPEAQEICHRLQAHAVSVHAKVKMCG